MPCSWLGIVSVLIGSSGLSELSIGTAAEDEAMLAGLESAKYLSREPRRSVKVVKSVGQSGCEWDLGLVSQ